MNFKKIFSSFSTLLLVGIIIFWVARYFYFQPQFNEGEPIPEFSATMMNSEFFQLSDLQGSYVLIDFWGSWCGPCRKENPQVVQLYQKYEKANFKSIKGFKIVSIGIERSEERWKNAIKRDNLYWKYHVLDKNEDMRFFDGKIAKEFGVKEVPTKYLLNEKGQIISVNPNVEELDKILQAQL